MAIPVCMPNAILVESLEVGHLGPNLAQMGFPMLNSPMLYNGDILLLIPHLIFTLGLSCQLWTYRKPYVANVLVTLNLTFDLIFKVIGQNGQYLAYY